MNETELRSKIASAQRTMLEVVKTHGQDFGRWDDATADRFDEAGRAETAAQKELDALTGPIERIAALESRVASANRELEKVGELYKNFQHPGSQTVPRDITWRRDQAFADKRSAEAELERLRSIRASRNRHPIDALDLERTNPQALRLAAMSCVEKSKLLTPTQQERCERLLAGDGVDNPVQLARHIVATGTPVYRRGWATGLVHPEFLAGYPEEQRALSRYESTMPVERRAATEGGAYGDAVPFDLDSAIIGTSGGLAAPVLDMCRMDVLTKGDTWHGVSSSLATGYGWVAEDGTFTDSSLTVGQPTLPIYKAAAVVPVSYELLEDYGGAGFQTEMQKILAQEFLTFMGNMTLNGTGSGGSPAQPYGIFAQMGATTTNPPHIVASTAGDLGMADVRNTWNALPDKFRSRAVWLMNPTALSQIESSVSNGAALSELRYTADGTPLLHGRPVVETEYAPSFTGTTSSTAQLLVLVDLSDGFLVANRVPTIVELTQTAQLPGATPTMQKFLVTSPRVGFGLLDPNFARILANS